MIKQGIKTLVSRFGYDLKKRKPNLATNSLSCTVNDIFEKNLDLSLNIQRNNRIALRDVKHWLNRKDYATSMWRYGIPSGPDAINKTEFNATYTDLLVFLAHQFVSSLCYLEIGVSAGKNLFQVCSSVEDAVLVGLDIELINPEFEGFFSKLEKLSEWNPKKPFIDYKGVRRNYLGSHCRYDFPDNRNELEYIRGDKFDEEAWRCMDGRKFNLIFSDAWHRPESISSEIDMIKKFDLLDPREFFIVFDDLNDDMLEAFEEIPAKLSPAIGGGKVLSYVTRAYGSYGYENWPHTIGIISTRSIL